MSHGKQTLLFFYFLPTNENCLIFKTVYSVNIFVTFTLNVSRSKRFYSCRTFSHRERSHAEQGWRTRPPPMCPAFKSRCRRHMWVAFVVGSLPCSERVFLRVFRFNTSSKTNFFEFQFDQEKEKVQSPQEVWDANMADRT